MCIEEHLIENALVSQQRYLLGTVTWEEAKSEFKEDDINQDMAKRADVCLDTVWRMAEYVTYTWNEGALMTDDLCNW